LFAELLIGIAQLVEQEFPRKGISVSTTCPQGPTVDCYSWSWVRSPLPINGGPDVFMEYSSSFLSRFWLKVCKDSGLGPNGDCWEWIASTTGSGYGSIRIGSRTDGSRTSLSAHRVSYELAFGPIPDGLEVLHRCDNRRCVKPDHFFLGTQVENSQDMYSKKRGYLGPRTPLKITDDQVVEIRKKLCEGVSSRRLAKLYGVSAPMISYIKNDKKRRTAF
jgi:hypothetical protein